MTWRAFLHEERQFVLLMLGAFTLISLIHLVTIPDATRWHGRDAGQWASALASGIPEVRDSALIALSTLQPDSGSTIHFASALLADSSDFVAESAVGTLILAGRRGGAPLGDALSDIAALLERDDARTKIHAARVLGAIGAPSAPALALLVTICGDSRATVRSASVAAVGLVLEGHPASIGAEEFDRAYGQLLVAAHDSAPEVRDAAIEALFRAMPGDTALFSILRAAEHDSSIDVRDRAAGILRTRVTHAVQ